jgi:hypothetical protein
MRRQPLRAHSDDGRYCAAEVLRGATTLSGGAVAEVHRAAGFDEVVVQAVDVRVLDDVTRA